VARQRQRQAHGSGRRQQLRTAASAGSRKQQQPATACICVCRGIWEYPPPALASCQPALPSAPLVKKTHTSDSSQQRIVRRTSCLPAAGSRQPGSRKPPEAGPEALALAGTGTWQPEALAPGTESSLALWIGTMHHWSLGIEHRGTEGARARLPLPPVARGSHVL
jgi:hypothetical protein